jgi:hypothetical protein
MLSYQLAARTWARHAPRPAEDSADSRCATYQLLASELWQIVQDFRPVLCGVGASVDGQCCSAFEQDYECHCVFVAAATVLSQLLQSQSEYSTLFVRDDGDDECAGSRFMFLAACILTALRRPCCEEVMYKKKYQVHEKDGKLHLPMLLIRLYYLRLQQSSSVDVEDAMQIDCDTQCTRQYCMLEQEPRAPENTPCPDVPRAMPQLDKNDTPYVTVNDPTAINIDEMTQKNVVYVPDWKEYGYLRSTVCTFSRDTDVLRAAFAHMGWCWDDVKAHRCAYLHDEITFDEDIKNDARVCFACHNGNVIRVIHASKELFSTGEIILDWPAAAISDTGSSFVTMFRRKKTKKVATAAVQLQRTVTLRNLRRQLRNIMLAFNFNLHIISPAEVARDLFQAAFLQRIGIHFEITADSEDISVLWQQSQVQKKATDDACAQRLMRLMMDVMHSSMLSRHIAVFGVHNLGAAVALNCCLRTPPYDYWLHRELRRTVGDISEVYRCIAALDQGIGYEGFCLSEVTTSLLPEHDSVFLQDWLCDARGQAGVAPVFDVLHEGGRCGEHAHEEAVVAPTCMDFELEAAV